VNKLGVGRPKWERRKTECVEVELQCAECVKRSASNVGLLVPDATSGQLRTIFLIIYPEDNCRPMLSAFLDEARPAAPPRKPVVAATFAPRAVAAVA